MASGDVARADFEQALRVDDPGALYEQAPCGYLSTQPDGLIAKVNQTFLTWTGFRRDELVGLRSLTDLLTAGSRVFHETHVRPLLHLTSHVSEIAMDMVRADGSVLPVLVNAVMDHDHEGTPVMVRVAVFDATERRHYELELLAAKKRAEESEKRLAVVARTLQETLMPPRSAHIDGLEVASAYRPAGAGDEIGGDFYDVFEVAARDWVVVIGDVAGKGVEAAVVATLARHTLRAVAISENSPAAMLSHLNQVLLGHPSGRFLTAAVLRGRRTGDRWDVVMAFGGHPPAIVLDADSSAHPVGASGHLVGAFDTSGYEDIRFELRPGWTLLLHTDGVTEARSPQTGAFYGEDRLMRLLHGGGTGAHELVDRVLHDVLEFQGGQARDDIALVTLQVPAER